MTNDVDTVCKWGLTKGWTHFLKAEKKNHIEILAFSDEVQTVKQVERLLSLTGRRCQNAIIWSDRF